MRQHLVPAPSCYAPRGHAAREPVYGLALIEELARHGYTLSAGTLYPVLHSLEAAGYLRRQDRVVGSTLRKY